MKNSWHYVVGDIHGCYQEFLKLETKIFDHAKKIGITIFSTPFDESAVDLLEKLDSPAYKIASFELTDISLIKYVAKKKKPIIISTGMASIEEIEIAVKCVKEEKCLNLALLHCISNYPTPIGEANLRNIKYLSKRLVILILKIYIKICPLFF